MNKKYESKKKRITYLHKVRLPQGPGRQLTPSVVPQYLHQSTPDSVNCSNIVGTHDDDVVVAGGGDGNCGVT